MTSKTHMLTTRQPGTRVATGTVAALLLAAFAQTSTASDVVSQVGPQPDWSSRIGTGQPFVTHSERAASAALSQDSSATAHWSARIGTGRAAAESRVSPVVSSSGVVAPAAHWSARIGTGGASPATDVRTSIGHKLPAGASRQRVDQPITEPLGAHPAMLVAQSWSSRAIDPNTFIVLHPAGRAPVSPAAPATEGATDDALKIASVTNK